MASEYAQIAKKNAAETRKLRKNLKKILKLPGNDRCADCDDPINAESGWGSISFGIVLCVQCAGMHRSVGGNQIRSFSLDTKTWCTTAHIELFRKIGGNTAANHKIWEHYLSTFHINPKHDKFMDASKQQMLRSLFVSSKYENQLWTPKRDKIGAKEYIKKMPIDVRQNLLFFYNRDTKLWCKKPEYLVIHGQYISRYASSRIKKNKCNDIETYDLLKLKVVINDALVDGAEGATGSDLETDEFVFMLFEDSSYIPASIARLASGISMKRIKSVRKEAEIIRIKFRGNFKQFIKIIHDIRATISYYRMYEQLVSIYNQGDEPLVIMNYDLQKAVFLGLGKVFNSTKCYFFTINDTLYGLSGKKDPRTVYAADDKCAHLNAKYGWHLNKIDVMLDDAGKRTGSKFALLLILKNKTIFIKFDKGPAVVQFYSLLQKEMTNTKGRYVVNFSSSPPTIIGEGADDDASHDDDQKAPDPDHLTRERMSSLRQQSHHKKSPTQILEIISQIQINEERNGPVIYESEEDEPPEAHNANQSHDFVYEYMQPQNSTDLMQLPPPPNIPNVIDSPKKQPPNMPPIPPQQMLPPAAPAIGGPPKPPKGPPAPPQQKDNTMQKELQKKLRMEQEKKQREYEKQKREEAQRLQLEKAVAEEEKLRMQRELAAAKAKAAEEERKRKQLEQETQKKLQIERQKTIEMERQRAAAAAAEVERERQRKQKEKEAEMERERQRKEQQMKMEMERRQREEKEKAMKMEMERRQREMEAAAERERQRKQKEKELAVPPQIKPGMQQMLNGQNVVIGSPKSWEQLEQRMMNKSNVNKAARSVEEALANKYANNDDSSGDSSSSSDSGYSTTDSDEDDENNNNNNNQNKQQPGGWQKPPQQQQMQLPQAAPNAQRGSWQGPPNANMSANQIQQGQRGSWQGGAAGAQAGMHQQSYSQNVQNMGAYNQQAANWAHQRDQSQPVKMGYGAGGYAGGMQPQQNRAAYQYMQQQQQQQRLMLQQNQVSSNSNPSGNEAPKVNNDVIRQQQAELNFFAKPDVSSLSAANAKRWVCKMCTFENKADATSCDMCTVERAKSKSGGGFNDILSPQQLKDLHAKMTYHYQQYTQLQRLPPLKQQEMHKEMTYHYQQYSIMYKEYQKQQSKPKVVKKRKSKLVGNKEMQYLKLQRIFSMNDQQQMYLSNPAKFHKIQQSFGQYARITAVPQNKCYQIAIPNNIPLPRRKQHWQQIISIIRQQIGISQEI